jgi:hypothetical protein
MQHVVKNNRTEFTSLVHCSGNTDRAKVNTLLKFCNLSLCWSPSRTMATACENCNVILKVNRGMVDKYQEAISDYQNTIGDYHNKLEEHQNYHKKILTKLADEQKNKKIL